MNHERGYQFEHILAPTLPDFQNKLRELHQWTPARCKGPQDHLLITRYACFVQLTAINKHDFLAGDGIFLWAARYRADYLAMKRNYTKKPDLIDRTFCGDSRTTFNPKSATPFKSIFS